MNLHVQNILESNDFQKKFDNAKTQLEKINVMLSDAHCTQILFNEVIEDKTVIDDTAVIQCFYGTDISRIKATTTALEYLLKSTKIPSTWIFVEGQKSRSDCVFTWLKRYGIKHVFKKITSDQDGLFLKTPLWNIGASICSENHLCFIDSDVCFCSSNWLERADNAFKKYDVISLAGYSYCENDTKCVLHESFGMRWLESRSFTGGHFGLTIGMTRSVFNTLFGFDATIILDDIQTYARIVGDDYISPFSEWLMVENRIQEKNGLDIKLGSTECIAWHADHGNTNANKYKTLVDIVKNHINEISDIIEYNKNDFNELPKWKNTKLANIIKRSIQICNNSDSYLDGNELYIEEMRKEYGIPDNDNIVICSIANGFGITYESFIKFRKLIDEKINSEIPVIVFTNSTFLTQDIGVDIIPLKNLNVERPYEQCMRNDVKFPDNTIVYYIPFNSNNVDNKIWIPDDIVKMNNGCVLFKINNTIKGKSKINSAQKITRKRKKND